MMLTSFQYNFSKDLITTGFPRRPRLKQDVLGLYTGTTEISTNIDNNSLPLKDCTFKYDIMKVYLVSPATAYMLVKKTILTS